MPFDREKFSNRLAALRAERGLDQAGLAERAGVSRDSIARYETGGAVPNLIPSTYFSPSAQTNRRRSR